MSSTHAVAEADKPNIVLLLVDDMGVMDTSVPMLTDENGKPKRHAWNDWYRTPNMERLDDISACAPLRGRKGAKWEGGMRVPFIAAWAKPHATNAWQKQLPIPAASIRQEIGVCYDLFPTIAEFVGAPIPADHPVDGQNLKQLLTGQSDPQCTL